MRVTVWMNAAFFLFACLGALDYLADNRFGLGEEFERGISCAGKLLIAMAGFMSLAAALGRILSPLVSGPFMAVGADPSAIAGILLATDAGGAKLAEEMALIPEAGAFHGYFVGSMLGGAVMCIIPMSMISTDARLRPYVVYGLVVGLFSVPFGCLAGGLCAGYSLGMVLTNLIPTTVCCAVLFAALLLFNRWVVRPFQLFGKLLLFINLAGLLLCGARELLGLCPVESLAPFPETMSVIGNIVLVLSGIFPLLSVLLRCFKRPVAALSRFLQIGQEDVTGLVTTLVNPFPALEKLKFMCPKGVMLNAAFLVPATCMLGDYFAFISSTRPELAGPVILGKLVSSILAVGITLIVQRTRLWTE